MSEQEGVIKFQLEFSKGDFITTDDITELDCWRHICYRLQLIGQDVNRYEGYGFGNISQRHPQLANQFFISGTQTGGASYLQATEYALVTDCQPMSNRIAACGQTKPSSEAMTHGQVYQLNHNASCIIHAHCPEIWRNADALNIPQTSAEVPYGTVQMAQEVMRLFNETDVLTQKIFSMRGHEDGVVCFGQNWQMTCHQIINMLARAIQIQQ